LRWRPVGAEADVLAVAEAGAGPTAASVVVSRRLVRGEGEGEDVQLVLERFSVRHETVWTVSLGLSWGQGRAAWLAG
jgi:hypothetical protein